MRQTTFSRRQLLAGTGPALSAGLAGCPANRETGDDAGSDGGTGRSGPLAATNEEDWPMFGANSQRNPVLTGTDGPAGPVSRDWQFQSHHVAPSVVDGTVYVDDATANYALDAETGETLWTRDSESDGGMTPVISDDTVYTFDGGGLTALDPSDGTHLWTDETLTAGAPVPRDGILYGANGETVFAFDPGERELRWSAPLESEDADDWNYLMEVAADDTHVYTVEAIGELTAYSIEDGEEQWSLSTAYFNKKRFSFTVAGGIVYLTALEGTDTTPKLRAIDASSGEVQWSDSVGILSGVTADRVYAPQIDDKGTYQGVYALDPVSGERLSDRSAIEGFSSVQPIVAGETLYYATADPVIRAFDLGSGEVRWEFRDSHDEIDHLLVAGERVFYKAGGTLHALSSDE